MENTGLAVELPGAGLATLGEFNPRAFFGFRPRFAPVQEPRGRPLPVGVGVDGTTGDWIVAFANVAGVEKL